jgi:hypothetical protein
MNSINDLCRRRKITSLDIQTPMLVPSFSSKNFDDIGETWEYLRGQIPDAVLLSAYDLFYGFVRLPKQGADVVFVDSGGYEAAIEYDIAEPVQRPYQPKEWDAEKHCLALEKVETLSSLVLVSYDNPKQDLRSQADLAREFFAKYPTCSTDFLLKPHQRAFIEPRLIADILDELGSFDILGITEKELGETIQNRALNLANIRTMLNQKGIDIPIHIFGCLDPISVWLYSFCGADIFDGLNWLRFVFQDNLPVYRNSWAVKNGFLTYNEIDLQALGWQNNLVALREQEISMSKFMSRQDVDLLPKELLPLMQSLDLKIN